MCLAHRYDLPDLLEICRNFLDTCTSTCAIHSVLDTAKNLQGHDIAQKIVQKVNTKCIYSKHETWNTIGFVVSFFNFIDFLHYNVFINFISFFPKFQMSNRLSALETKKRQLFRKESSFFWKLRNVPVQPIVSHRRLQKLPNACPLNPASGWTQMNSEICIGKKYGLCSSETGIWNQDESEDIS